MTDHSEKADSRLAPKPDLAAAAFAQAWENIRLVRSERIWFTNVYCGIVAGSLAFLQRDEEHTLLPAMGLLVLVLFSLVSLTSSIRLVAELKHAIANLQRIIDANGIGGMVGPIEPPPSFGPKLSLRWVFPIFYALSTACLIVVFVAKVIAR